MTSEELTMQRDGNFYGVLVSGKIEWFRSEQEAAAVEKEAGWAQVSSAMLAVTRDQQTRPRRKPQPTVTMKVYAYDCGCKILPTKHTRAELLAAQCDYHRKQLEAIMGRRA